MKRTLLAPLAFLVPFSVGCGSAPAAPTTPTPGDVAASAPSAQPVASAIPGDQDGDGIPDKVDACPKEKGVKSDNPNWNGCADSDGDGVPDKEDACPDKKGTSTNKGCP